MKDLPHLEAALTRVLFGWVLMFHGLGHTHAFEWVAARGTSAFAMEVWSLSLPLYMAAGLGLLRVPVLRRHWYPLMLVATGLSALMLVWYKPPMWPGLGVDAVVLLMTEAFRRAIDADLVRLEAAASVTRQRPWVRLGHAVGVACLVYATAVMAIRPASLRWGTTPLERAAPLPGDPAPPGDATYRVDHAITIHAPESQVWLAVLQLLGESPGFDRHTSIEPGRAIRVEGQGTFVLVALDSANTRLIVRSLGTREPSLASIVHAPLDAFLLQPVRFVAERDVLRGIRDRAERSRRPEGTLEG